MDLSGSHLLDTTPDHVWAMLMDTEILARIVPGITTLEKTDENKYKAVAQVKMGPVSGTFSGGLTMQDIREGEGYTLNVKQNSQIGNADATVQIDLKPSGENQTELSFRRQCQTIRPTRPHRQPRDEWRRQLTDEAVFREF